MSIFELIGNLSVTFGKEVFTKSLESTFMMYLTNPAASVRDMGIQKSAEIAAAFKGDWILSSFVPKVVDNYNVEKQGYNYRMTSLLSLAAVMPHLQKD